MHVIRFPIKPIHFICYKDFLKMVEQELYADFIEERPYEVNPLLLKGHLRYIDTM